MPPRFGAMDSNGVYHISTDPKVVAQESGSQPSVVNQESFDRKDAFLKWFTDIVDHDSPPATSHPDIE